MSGVLGAAYLLVIGWTLIKVNPNGGNDMGLFYGLALMCFAFFGAWAVVVVSLLETISKQGRERGR